MKIISSMELFMFRGKLKFMVEVQWLSWKALYRFLLPPNEDEKKVAISFSIQLCSCRMQKRKRKEEITKWCLIGYFLFPFSFKLSASFPFVSNAFIISSLYILLPSSFHFISPFLFSFALSLSLLPPPNLAWIGDSEGEKESERELNGKEMES